MSVDPIEQHKQKEDNLRVGARGGAVAYILQIGGTALGFINQVALARMLGTNGIGEVILALTIVYISGLLAAFGMQGAMMRFVPQYAEKEEKEKLKGIIYLTLIFCSLLSIVFAVVILIASKYIALNVFHAPALLKLLPIVVIALPLNVLNSLIQAILKGYKNTFKALLPHAVISPLVRLVFFLLLSFFEVSSLYAIVAYILGELIALVLSLTFLFNKMSGTNALYRWNEFKEIIRVGPTMIIATFGWFLFSEADIWIVGMYSSTEAVGIYGVAVKMCTFIIFTLYAFSTIMPPIISSLHASGDTKELRRVISESSRWILTSSMPIVLIFILEGDIILKYMYGSEFSSGYIVLVILSLGQLVNAGSGLTGWFLQMTGGHMAFMKITIFWGICNVILNIIFVPRFGIIASAVSTSFTLSMVNIMSVWLIYKKSSILTLAKGLQFDIVFIAVIASLYFILRINNVNAGQHYLLIAALVIYMWKSVACGDFPWRYLKTKSIL
ncbi:MAG: flippase [Thermodesulfovibrionia bacterium]|nr:flippase [Thermodesulfovibrionia bacterium]